jgi:hypothetical protein
MAEGTRIDRRPTRLLPDRVVPPLTPDPDPDRYGFEERLALFTVSLAKERAFELLEGLHRSTRRRAREHARRVASWDSSTRQARLTWVFGSRKDAGERLRALWAEASPLLRRELYRLLPPYHRTALPDGPPPTLGEPACPGLLSLAERLVREATR